MRWFSTILLFINLTQGLIQELILGSGSWPLRLLSKAGWQKMQLGVLGGCCKPSSGVGLKPPINSCFTFILACNALYFNSWYVSRHLECPSGVIAMKFGILGSLIKMCINVFIWCLIRHFLFCFKLYLFYRKVYC